MAAAVEPGRADGDGQRVLHLVRSCWPAIGGLEASVHGLARAQAAMGLQVRVASPGARPCRHEGVSYRPIHRVGPRRYPFARGLGRHLRWADVVHVHGVDGLADLAVRRHPRVGVSTHGGFFHTSRHRWIKAVVLRTVSRATLRSAGAVWFTSDADRRALRGAGVHGPVIGDGIDLDELEAVPWRPVPGRWVVPGRVDVHKGLADLVRWLEVLGGDGPEEVRVVGPLSRPELVPDLRRAGLVVVGPVARGQLLEEVSHAERVVLPSRFEGFGIAAAEVMAMGVPVVLSDIPAHRELDVASPAGRLDLQRPDGLRHRSAALDPEGLVDARRRAMRRHGWPQVCARYLTAYGAL